MQTGCFLNNQEESYIIYIIPGGSSCSFVCLFFNERIYHALISTR